MACMDSLILGTTWNSMFKRVKHSLCFNKEGVCKRPDDFLARINIMINIGNRLDHNAAGDKLFTDEEFKLAFWSTFDDSQQNWLTDNQNMDPYNQYNAFGPNKIAEQVLRHWHIHLQEKRKAPKDGLNNQDGGNNNKRRKTGDHDTNRNQNTSRNNNKGNRGTYPIPGHAQKHSHG